MHFCEFCWGWGGGELCSQAEASREGCVRVCVCVYEICSVTVEGLVGGFFGLGVLSVYLSPSKAISQRGRPGSQLLHCLALHQLTKALPLWIRVEEGLFWAVGKGRESEIEREGGGRRRGRVREHESVREGE